MLNMSTVNAAVKVILDDALPTYNILRAPYTNQDADKCPWIGIYRGPSEYDPRVLGPGKGKKWRANNIIRLQVQAASSNSGQAAEEKLEQYIGEVTDALFTDPTLGGTVSTIVGVSVDYSFNEEQSETMYFHMATVDIKVEART
jgi:hypothetical protein